MATGPSISSSKTGLIVSHVGDQSLFVLAKPSCSAAILSVGINAALLKLGRMSSVSRPSDALSSMRSGTRPAAADRLSDAFPALSTTNQPAPPARTMQGSRGGPPPLPVTPAPSASFSASFANASESNVSVATIRGLMRILSKFTDEDAQALIRQVTGQMGATPSTVPLTRYPELLQELAAQLPSRFRRDFLNLASEPPR